MKKIIGKIKRFCKKNKKPENVRPETDAPSKQEEVKKRLKSLGYLDE
ncbi:MAG: hypothetical protein PHU56_02030 [Candidatus Pacebacteria bacterium]|nr:hypothetical protein [Candidatus Paceibacterota bacterium]